MSKALFLRRLLFVLGFVALLMVVGTVGYLQLPGWSVSDAVYMSAITITAVGRAC